MSKDGNPGDDLLCSFCGKSQEEVKKLIAGPSVYICDECIQLCNEIIDEEYAQEREEEDRGELLKPAEIKELLDQYVIEQDKPKKILSVAVHNHYKRISTKIDMDLIEWTTRELNVDDCQVSLISKQLGKFSFKTYWKISRIGSRCVWYSLWTPCIVPFFAKIEILDV